MLRNAILGAAVISAIGMSVSEVHAAPPIVLQPGTGGIPLPGYFPPAYPMYPQPRYDVDYLVLVKHGHHWHRQGRYETLRQAEFAVRRLERQGLFVRIDTVRGRW